MIIWEVVVYSTWIIICNPNLRLAQPLQEKAADFLRLYKTNYQVIIYFGFIGSHHAVLMDSGAIASPRTLQGNQEALEPFST